MKHSNHKRKPLITQDLLEEFREAWRAQAELRRRQRELRQYFLEATDAGSRVEPGNLILRITPQAQRRMSRSKLLEFVGRRKFDEFFAGLEPTIVRRVSVEPTEEYHGGLWFADDQRWDA